MEIFLMLLFLTMVFFLTIIIIHTFVISIRDGLRINEPDVSPSDKEDKEKKHKVNDKKLLIVQERKKIVDLWESELLKLGESPNRKDLEHIANQRIRPETLGAFQNEIPHYAIMTKEEFLAIGDALRPLGGLKIDSQYYDTFELERLPAAIKAKYLASKWQVFSKTLAYLGEKNIWNSSQEYQEEYLRVLKQKKELSEEINTLCKIEFISDKLVFSRVVQYSESEMLSHAKEMMENPVKKVEVAPEPELVSVAEIEKTIQSPALEELNDFLTEHDLPEEVRMKVEQTIREIKEALRKEQEEKETQILNEKADVLIATAKNWHQLSDKGE